MPVTRGRRRLIDNRRNRLPTTIPFYDEKEVTADVLVKDFDRPVFHVKRYGGEVDGVTDDFVAVTRAIAAANAVKNSTQGALVDVGDGLCMTGAPILPSNRVKLIGSSARGTQIRAMSNFSGGAHVVDFANGTDPMFDTGLENIGVSANGVAALSCVRHRAFQENSIFRNVLLNGFTVYGLELINGYGGAALGLIENVEILGEDGATGMYLDVPGMILTLRNVTIAGNRAEAPLDTLVDGVNIQNIILNAELMHFERCTDCFDMQIAAGKLYAKLVTTHATTVNTIRVFNQSCRVVAKDVATSSATSITGAGVSETAELVDFFYPNSLTRSAAVAAIDVSDHCPHYTINGTGTITSLGGVQDGQRGIFSISGANVTFDFSVAALHGNGSASINLADDDRIHWQHFNGVTSCIINPVA